MSKRQVVLVVLAVVGSGILSIAGLAFYVSVGGGEADPYTTGVASAVTATGFCFEPEDRGQSDLAGCYRAAKADAAKLRERVCVGVRLPAEGPGSSRTVEELELLDRKCRSHGESP